MDDWFDLCYGWGQTPLANAARRLQVALGLGFVPHENSDLGRHWFALHPSLTIQVADNDKGRGCDVFPPLREPAFPEQRTLIFVDGPDMAAAWWRDLAPRLAALEGMALLSGRPARSRSTASPALGPLDRFGLPTGLGWDCDAHAYAFGWGATPLAVAAGRIGARLGVALEHRRHPRVPMSDRYSHRARAWHVVVTGNYGYDLGRSPRRAQLLGEPDHPEHRTLVRVGHSDPVWWEARGRSIQDLNGLVLLRHDVTRTRCYPDHVHEALGC